MSRTLPEVELKQFLMRNKFIARYNEQEIYLNHEAEKYYHVTIFVGENISGGTVYGEYDTLGEASYAAARADQQKQREAVSVGGPVTKIANKEKK